MPHNVDSMAYYGEVPWHGLGTSIPERANSEQMIVAAGLDWSVESRPARGTRKDKKERYSRYEIVRLPRPHRSEYETLLGVTSRFYVPLQNKEAFEFFDPVVGEGKACFETAGALGEVRTSPPSVSAVPTAPPSAAGPGSGSSPPPVTPPPKSPPAAGAGAEARRGSHRTG